MADWGICGDKRSVGIYVDVDTLRADRERSCIGYRMFETDMTMTGFD